jgi:mono/diheme cytochrome c family protein
VSWFAWLALSLAAAAGAADWEAPPEEKAKVSPLAVTPKDLAKGRSLFLRHCSSCHGRGGKGDGPAAGYGVEIPDDLTDPARQDRLSDGEIFWKIANGRRLDAEIVMPSFSREISSEADRWRVVAFVRSLRQAP